MYGLDVCIVCVWIVCIVYVYCMDVCSGARVCSGVCVHVHVGALGVVLGALSSFLREGLSLSSNSAARLCWLACASQESTSLQLLHVGSQIVVGPHTWRMKILLIELSPRPLNSHLNCFN